MDEEVAEQTQVLEDVVHKPNKKIWAKLVKESSSSNEVFVLLNTDVFIGRAKSCEIRIDDPHISSKHCKLEKRITDPDNSDSYDCFLTDLSTNGTFVNNERCPKDVPIRIYNNDIITIAVDENTFQYRECNKPTLKRGLTVELAREIRPTKRIMSVRSLKYFEVDEERLLKSGNIEKTWEEPTGVKFVKIKRPHVADTSYAAEEFKKCELAFRRFINRDRMFHVVSVDVILNPELEKKYKETEKLISNPTIETLKSKWEGKEAEKKAIDTLCESIYWCTENEAANGNPILAWHGTREENITNICTTGFKNLSQKDSGWYGKGMYFTQLPNYGEFYVNNCNAEIGESCTLLLSWVLLGNPFPVTEKIGGIECKEGYDSNFVLVNGFEPCELDKEPTGDEIVVFKEGQVLPRYIVHYEVIKKAKFTPISLLDSSDDESETEEPENKLPSVEIVTGEEHENNLLSIENVKLFELDAETKSWKEKGEGEFKFNENTETKAHRMIVRMEGVGKVLLNLSVFAHMHSEIRGAKKRDLFIGTYVDNKPVSYLIRFASPEVAGEVSALVEKFKNV